jgi:hypothetical protein
VTKRDERADWKAGKARKRVEAEGGRRPLERRKAGHGDETQGSIARIRLVVY